jgi:hypothetical protein
VAVNAYGCLSLTDSSWTAMWRVPATVCQHARHGIPHEFNIPQLEVENSSLPLAPLVK